MYHETSIRQFWEDCCQKRVIKAKVYVVQILQSRRLTYGEVTLRLDTFKLQKLLNLKFMEYRINF